MAVTDYYRSEHVYRRYVDLADAGDGGAGA